MIVVRAGNRRSGLHYLARANHVAAAGLVPVPRQPPSVGGRGCTSRSSGEALQTVARHTSAVALATSAH